MRHTKTMAKTTVLNGRRVNLKYVREVSIGAGQALLLSLKEAYVFSVGFLLILSESGERTLISTDNCQESPFNFAFYDDETVGRIVFQDEQLSNQWEKLFLYLYDESGSCLLYADHDALPHVGYRFESVNCTLTTKIRQEALTIAGLLDRTLMKQILIAEKQITDDEDQNSLLQLGGPSWE